MPESITIAPRFSGPRASGHGGYVCGVVAGLLSGPAEVTLRRPPPLGRPLPVRRLDDGGVELRDGEVVVAHGTPAIVEPEVPEPVTLDQAVAAARAYHGFRQHTFPTCFACGPDRAEGDGLRIFPGVVPGRGLVAAPWVPDVSLADDTGRVRAEFVWAALDCPSGWAVILLTTEGSFLLGRLGVRSLGPVGAGERCVVVGWPGPGEGRKWAAGAALLSERGEVRAVASALWIRLGGQASSSIAATRDHSV